MYIFCMHYVDVTRIYIYILIYVIAAYPSVHQFSKTSTATEQFKPQYSSPAPVTSRLQHGRILTWDFNGELETLWENLSFSYSFPIVFL